MRKPFFPRKGPRTGRSIFGTIFVSLLAVLAVQIILLTFSIHAMQVGPQLNRNAEDILNMQVNNRTSYIQSLFNINQKSLSTFGKYHIAAILFKKLNTEFLFQRCDCMTQAGLGNREDFSCFCIMFQMSESSKISEMIEIHKVFSFSD